MKLNVLWMPHSKELTKNEDQIIITVIGCEWNAASNKT